MNLLRIFLFGVGVPASIAVIVRFVPVVREQRHRWLLVHHLGVAAIVVGWATLENWGAVAVNLAWLASSTIWYVAGRRIVSRGRFRSGGRPTTAGR